MEATEVSGHSVEELFYDDARNFCIYNMEPFIWLHYFFYLNWPESSRRIVIPNKKIDLEFFNWAYSIKLYYKKHRFYWRKMSQ